MEAAADWASLRSPENYLGDERTDNFVSPRGSDVGDQSNGTVTDPRLYQLIRQHGPVSDHTLEATF